MPATTPDVTEVLASAVDALGGETRPGQVEMAQAVALALKSEKHLLVQAGTGTGKSIGYLVPALLHARACKGRVIVATSTLALQRQIVSRDLPALVEAMGDSAEHQSYAVLKGRNNYACLHRVNDGVPDEQGALLDVPTGSLGAEVVALREWALQQSDSGGHGDRDEAPSHGDQAWRQVSVTSRECVGASACRWSTECFSEQARERASEAEVVVTNHALLAIDAIGGVPALPGYDAVIIDEAHDLTARVTQSATQSLDAGTIERAARRALALTRESDAAGDLTLAADALADVVTHVEPGRIDALDEGLRDALAYVRDAARATLTALKDAQSGDDDAPVVTAKAAVEELRLTADRMAQLKSTDVLWLSDLRQGLSLNVAPIDVADDLAEKLFGPTTCILTSATLTLGGSFAPLAAAVGLRDADAWTGIDVGSPFDYARQGILYVAEHLPAPGRDGLEIDQLGEITALVKAAGGRTLGLFSSRRGAERAAEYVRQALPDLEILCQGDAHLSELTTRFIEEPTTSLFGTLGLWQGIDVPGDTCTLVLIDRVPFPRPDDPVMSARAKLVVERGGNGFMQVSAQHAALLLAQGAGRLIRRTTDRGVVAILDPRIVTARYGRFLAASLPPLWKTTDRSVVVGALERLSAGLGNT